MKLTGENRSIRGKNCPSATLSTKNPTWIDPGSNPGLSGERPATNRLSHGTACDGLDLLMSHKSACVTVSLRMNSGSIVPENRSRSRSAQLTN
jgi:hypothetical protein